MTVSKTKEKVSDEIDMTEFLGESIPIREWPANVKNISDMVVNLTLCRLHPGEVGEATQSEVQNLFEYIQIVD